MKLRETLFGLLVLAVLLGGAFWVRSRSGAANAPAAGSPAASAAAPVDPAALPDVTLADAPVDLGDVRLVLSADRPVVAFAKSRFRVRAEKDGAAVPIGDGRLSFEMAMPMGDHRYGLVGDEDGWHAAEVVLPMCKSGKRTWFATLEGNVGGKAVAARWRVDLTPPAEAPAPAPAAK